MNLRTQTDYALRTLLYLAYRGQQVRLEEVATAYQVSKDHLEKVVQQLVRFGYVQSRPGRNGGMRLGKAPADINVGEVVARFEGRNGVLPCISDETYCRLDPGCALKSALIQAEEAFYEKLSRLTIGALVESNVAKGNGGLYNLRILRSGASNEPGPDTQARDNRVSERKRL